VVCFGFCGLHVLGGPAELVVSEEKEEGSYETRMDRKLLSSRANQKRRHRKHERKRRTIAT